MVAPKDRTVHSNMPEESDSKEGGGDADLAVMAKERELIGVRTHNDADLPTYVTYFNKTA